MRVLRAADRIASPWKNGGGTTREVLVYPPDVGFDTFDWRISIASVQAPGPFSHLPGIDRRLAVLAGRLILKVADRAPIEVDANGAALELAGDAPTYAELPDGPATDLNVMTRRGRFRSTLVRKALAAGEILSTRDAVTVLVAGTPLHIELHGESHDLLQHDAVVFERPAAVLLIPAAPTSICYLIGICGLQEKK